MTERTITHRYDDPLDLLWLETARAIGLRVTRSAEVFAATDGRGTLTVGEASTLDADDCLAQMIFHELCHSLVQGPRASRSPTGGSTTSTIGTCTASTPACARRPRSPGATASGRCSRRPPTTARSTTPSARSAGRLGPGP